MINTKIKHLLLVIIIILLLSSTVNAYPTKNEPSTHLSCIDSKIQVNYDTSLFISQNVEYYVRHREDVIFFVIPIKDNQEITNFNLESSAINENYTIEKVEDKYLVEIELDKKMYENGLYETNISLNLSYTLNNAVTLYNDVAELKLVLWESYYNRVFNAYVQILFPGEGNIEVWTLTPEVTDEKWINDTSYVIQNVKKRSQFEEHYIMPRSFFTQENKVNTVNNDGYDQVIRNHTEITLEQQHKAYEERVLLEIFFIIICLPLLSFVLNKLVRIKFNFKKISEFPDDSSLLKVNAINNGNVGVIDSCGFLAVLVNLMNRGYITTIKNSYGCYIKLTDKDRTKLKNYEFIIIEYIDKISYNDPSIRKNRIENNKNNNKVVSFIDLKILCLENPLIFKNFSNFMKEFRTTAINDESIGNVREYFDDKYFRIHQKIAFAMLIILLISLITLTIMYFTGTDTIVYIIVVLILLLEQIFLLSRVNKTYGKWTKKGLEYNKNWDSFKKYLKDYNEIERNPPKNMEQWLEFMEYAAALGVLANFAVNTKKYFNLNTSGEDFEEYPMMKLLVYKQHYYFNFFNKYDGRFFTQSFRAKWSDANRFAGWIRDRYY